MCYQYLTEQAGKYFSSTNILKTYRHFQYKTKNRKPHVHFFPHHLDSYRCKTNSSVVTELTRLLCGGGGGHHLHIYIKGHIAPGVERLLCQASLSCLLYPGQHVQATSWQTRGLKKQTNKQNISWNGDKWSCFFKQMKCTSYFSPEGEAEWVVWP